jgi:hypothetical protein
MTKRGGDSQLLPFTSIAALIILPLNSSWLTHARYRGWPDLHIKIHRSVSAKNYPRYPRNLHFLGFKKTFKKVKKKLASP